MPNTSATDASQRLVAIVLVCGAGLFFALLDTTAKYLGQTTDMPLAQIVWVRFVGHAALSVVMLGPHRIASLARTTKPLFQWARSGLLLSATACNFVAITYLRLDQTATIFFLAPLVVAALAGPLLGEWIGWHRLVAVLVGFLGIVVVMRPGFGWIHWAAIFSVGAMLSYSLYNIATRYLSHHDSSAVTQFYTPLAGLIALAPWAIANWAWPASTFDWLLLVWLGAAGAFGHWLFIHAALRAPAPVIAPFIYVNLVWMASLGFLVFGDVPDIATLTGGAIVVCSGLYLIYRERNRRAR